MDITIYVDTRITRRQSVSRVIQSDGTVLFTDKRLVKCLGWCLDMGHLQVRLLDLQGVAPSMMVSLERRALPEGHPV